jgi:ATP-dependent Clp protease ATP-binding subunit ClpC
MPNSYRVPTLLWQDAAGSFCAAICEWEDRVAVARTSREAMEQVRDFLEWKYREFSWLGEPDFADAEMDVLRVPVRPEYVIATRLSVDERRKRRGKRRGKFDPFANQRRAPLNESFVLRVHFVQGRRSNGQRIAALPWLGVRFDFHESDDLKNLVTHAVQQRLLGVTPQQLSRFVPPDDVRLENVVFSCRARAARPADLGQLHQLAEIAEPLGDSQVRSQFGRAWERDAVVAELTRRLTREKASLLIVGESGSGKTTVIVESARQAERFWAEQPRDADDDRRPAKRRLWQTSAGRLIAGMKYLGQWEQRVEGIISDLELISGVLVVENLLDLVRTGDCDPTGSIGSFLVPYLRRGQLRVIAEATPAELDACRRLLPALADAFQVLPLAPLDAAASARALRHVADMAEQWHEVTVADDVPTELDQLFRRFQPYHALPGPAARFLRETCEFASRMGTPARPAVLHLEGTDRTDGTNESRTGKSAHPPVTTALIRERFSKQTGLPEYFLRDDCTLARDDVFATFQRQIVGQPAACNAVADVVVTFKAGLNDPKRPLGVLLFCGPTGVGKTELAKCLSRYFFGETRLVRLDMSEFSSPWSADRLLMQRTGEPSTFIQQMRQQPFAIVLLDEIEKAHPDVFDVLMNVFDEGRLTDQYGRATYFRSAIIILTSNLGAGSSGSLGFGTTPTPRFDAAARSFFRPEFYNRLDSVVTFNPLSAESIRAIAAKELESLNEREGLTKAQRRLICSPEVIDLVAQSGFDAKYGARPLQRAVERLVATPLAKWLLDHGNLRQTTIRAECSREGLIEFQSDTAVRHDP